jgi:hypothetical protein
LGLLARVLRQRFASFDGTGKERATQEEGKGYLVEGEGLFAKRGRQCYKHKYIVIIIINIQ